MAGYLQKFLPQSDTTLSTGQNKKGSVRTEIIEAIYTNSREDALRKGKRGDGTGERNSHTLLGA